MERFTNNYKIIRRSKGEEVNESKPKFHWELSGILIAPFLRNIINATGVR
jgi:hypothetical protein